MAKAATTTKAQRVFFTNTDDAVDLPSLVDHQNKSFQWFVQEGLGELLAEISPIDDYTGGKLSLRFKDYKFGDPKLTEAAARENNVDLDVECTVGSGFKFEPCTTARNNLSTVEIV